MLPSQQCCLRYYDGALVDLSKQKKHQENTNTVVLYLYQLFFWRKKIKWAVITEVRLYRLGPGYKR